MKKEVKPYVYQEFPKWKYHQELGAKIVHSKDHEDDLGAGWKDSPAYLEKKEEASVPLSGKLEMPKRRGRPAKAKE